MSFSCTCRQGIPLLKFYRGRISFEGLPGQEHVILRTARFQAVQVRRRRRRLDLFSSGFRTVMRMLQSGMEEGVQRLMMVSMNFENG